MLALAISAVLVPIAYMVLTALTPHDLLFDQIIPERVTFQNLLEVFSTDDITLPYRNSIVISTMTALITLAFASIAGYGLSRFRFRLSGTLIVLLLFTQIIPMEILVLSYFPFLKAAKLMDTWVALILVDTTLTLPFCTLILKSMFDGIPKEIEDAAKIDGCSSFGCFFKITLPLSWGGMLAGGIFAFLMAWQEFIYGLSFTASLDARPITVALSLLIGHYVISWEELMATSFLTALPLLVVFAIFQGAFIKGLIAGGVKG
ncbi:MAG: carbohydrate ABC transporter permease [Pseudomonadales bacterium]